MSKKLISIIVSVVGLLATYLMGSTFASTGYVDKSIEKVEAKVNLQQEMLVRMDQRIYELWKNRPHKRE